MEPILRIENLKTYFPIRKGVFSKVVGHVHAVNGVDLEVNKGETLGLVGESGCGKSTLGKTLLKLEQPTQGSIEFRGTNITKLTSKEMKPLRKNMQMIFQDPFSSLDPRMTVEKIIIEPLKLNQIGDRDSQRQKACDLIKKVGLNESFLHRYPHEFSGGQRQRIGIARALALNPEVIIADEPVAALDVSIQAQVLNLMNDLKKEFGLTYVFISHDLGVIKYFSDRIAVMYLGRIVELATSGAIYENPLHPYTRALISSIPTNDPRKRVKRTVLTGDVPSPIAPPPGCSFHTRCPFAAEVCSKEIPELQTMDTSTQSHKVACHFSAKFLNEQPKH